MTRKNADELTERQKLFCLHYVKCFNATQAALKAGYAKSGAHVEGSRMLNNPKIAAEITRLKGKITKKIHLSAMDILTEYAKIAFADVGDYVTFGQREEQVMNIYGPLFIKGKKRGEKVPVMRTVNYVDLGDSDKLDTSVIAEIKQDKKGVSIKLHDKMRALEKLEQYFDLLPDKFKRKVIKEKLAIEREKLEIDRAKAGLDTEEEDETGIVEIPGLVDVDTNEGIDLGTLDLDKPEVGGNG